MKVLVELKAIVWPSLIATIHDIGVALTPGGVVNFGHDRFQLAFRLAKVERDRIEAHSPLAQMGQHAYPADRPESECLLNLIDNCLLDGLIARADKVAATKRDQVESLPAPEPATGHGLLDVGHVQ